VSVVNVMELENGHGREKFLVYVRRYSFMCARKTLRVHVEIHVRT